MVIALSRASGLIRACPLSNWARDNPDTGVGVHREHLTAKRWRLSIALMTGRCKNPTVAQISL
jgi:hypothetical protein